MKPVPFDPPAGLFSDDTRLAAKGRWADMSNMRFWEGRAQVIGGWESLTIELVSGVCRSVLAWTDQATVANIALGTHTALQVLKGGNFSDITPEFGAPTLLAANPFAVVDGSATVTVSHPAHGFSTGDSRKFVRSVNVGRVSPNGTYPVTKIDADHYSYEMATPADLAKPLAANPLKVTIGMAVVVVTEAAHGIVDGTPVTISGAGAIGGITPNGTFPVTVIDANTYSFRFTADATATVAAGGGGSVVATIPATGGGSSVGVASEFLPGQIDGTGGSGYGTGAYGAGAYSEPSTADTFPRTWSLSPFGETLIANPRREGIYEWGNNPAQAATLLENAPFRAVYTLVTASDQIMALGCNEEASGVFKPLCIRHSSIRKKNEWHTSTNTTAREYTLPGGGEIVAGRNMGAYVLVWTTAALYVGTFQASLAQPWRFERVGEKCGLIGPNAAVVSGLTAMWLAPDLQFRSYSLGGQVQVVPCPIREDMAQNFAASQGDKVVASSLERFGEIRFDYPDARDGFENSRYVVFSRLEGAWSRGRMPRSAMVDAGPLADPIGVAPSGNLYWHERGNSNDGAAFAWFIESGELVLSEEASMMVRGVLPDIARQIGGVVLSLFSRLKPQEPPRAFPPVVMAPGDAKADIRASGRYFRVRLSGSAAPTFARLGRMTFDCKASARR